jgi:hypothetical protein
MTHEWCRDIEMDARVRAAEDGKPGPLPTLEEAIARPFAEAAKCSSTVSETGEGQSGLRTERVTLEIAHSGEYSAARWGFAYCLRPLYALESVRVVSEEERDAEVAKLRSQNELQLKQIVEFASRSGDDLNVVRAEREAAIRERDAARARAAEDARAYSAESDARAQAQQELHDRCDTAFVPKESAGRGGAERLHRETWLRLERDELIVKRDELISRVAELERQQIGLRRDLAASRNRVEVLEAANSSSFNVIEALESQLESVADRAAAAETALEAAQAASGGGVIRDMTDILRSDADADEKHAALSTLVDAVCPGWALTQAASGGGEGEPDAWGVVRDGNVESVTHRRFRGDADRVAEQWGETVVPLYRSHPQPRGWLSQDEREIIAGIADDDEYTEEGQDIAKQLLARSSPPEVVAPAFVETHNAFRNQAIRERDRQWLTAIAAAGVAVKETT